MFIFCMEVTFDFLEGKSVAAFFTMDFIINLLVHKLMLFIYLIVFFVSVFNRITLLKKQV